MVVNLHNRFCAWNIHNGRSLSIRICANSLLWPYAPDFWSGRRDEVKVRPDRGHLFTSGLRFDGTIGPATLVQLLEVDPVERGVERHQLADWDNRSDDFRREFQLAVSVKAGLMKNEKMLIIKQSVGLVKLQQNVFLLSSNN